MILKCEVCGANIDFDESTSIATCKYCDSKMIVSKNKDKIENLKSLSKTMTSISNDIKNTVNNLSEYLFLMIYFEKIIKIQRLIGEWF